MTTVLIEIDANFVSADELEDSEEYGSTLAFASVSLWLLDKVRGQRFAIPMPRGNQLRDHDFRAEEPDFKVTVIDMDDW